MLVVDRAVAGDPGHGRVRRLLGGLGALPADVRVAPSDPGARARAVDEAVAQREPIYVVDHLRLTLGLLAGHPRARVIVDVGDEAASVARTKGRPLLEVGGLLAAQRFVECRARGVVVRGLGHVGALATRPWSRPYCLVPDACSPPDRWAPRPATSDGLTLGFVGSSAVSRRAPPAGWEVPELLRLLPGARGLAVLDGTGEAHIRRRAAELGVADRLRILPATASDRLADVLEGVDVCISTQTANLAGQVRTTGKLVEYLALGKVVVASRAGTAAAVLPPFLTVDRDDVFSAGYVEAMAERITALARMPEPEFLELQRYNRSLALTLFSPAVLAPLWVDKMREWEVLPP